MAGLGPTRRTLGRMTETHTDQTEEAVPYVEHLGDSRQYWRDIILGVNDGLVSMFLLVAAVVGGGLETTQVLLTGIGGAIAGAISMGVGEYIATKSQEEVFDREMELEREHIQYHRDRELAELRDMFTETGLDRETADRVVAAYDRDDDALMQIMMALEFGVIDQERRSPWVAMAVSGGLFLTGALPSVVPFVFDVSPTNGLTVAAVLAGAALFLVGAVKTLATRGSWWRSGAENFLLGGLGAIVSFLVGSWYGGSV